MTARLITKMGAVDLCVPYRCRHCGAHLGEFVSLGERVHVDFGRGPRASKYDTCACGRNYLFSTTDYTIEQVVAMREKNG